ncbi:TetR/AcrR family transcriptional regulator [Nonomuraea sp. NPDC049784]|uniref:TetR/AcrR family transcriptional regulator n=1 Tax=Nonomuraea sp. NPDC049784 TaxID=3154361 RepID=UPI0033E407B2
MATTAGRRRDPEVDRKVTDAAIALYGECGWAGFSIEAVARASGAGKASIYLRWPSREALLVDALTSRIAPVTEVDTGNVRDDLLGLARQMLDLYLGDAGRAALRMGLEAEGIPAVDGPWQALRASQSSAARALVRRAIDRGELPSETPVTMLLDTLCGGAMMHVMATPADLRERLAADPGEFAARLVDFLLAAVNR